MANLLNQAEVLRSLDELPAVLADEGLRETRRRMLKWPSPDADFVKVVVDLPPGQGNRVREQIAEGSNVRVGSNPDEDCDHRSMLVAEALAVFVEVNGHGYVQVGMVAQEQVPAMRARLQSFYRRLKHGGVGGSHYPLIELQDGSGVYFVQLL